MARKKKKKIRGKKSSSGRVASKAKGRTRKSTKAGRKTRLSPRGKP